MPLYLTGLITTDYWRFPPFPYLTPNWRLQLIKTAESQQHLERRMDSEGPLRRKYGKEVAIKARDEAAARRVASILDAAAQILAGSAPQSLPRFECSIELKRVSGSTRSRSTPELAGRARQWHPGIPLECMLAVKAARRRNWVYALSKLWLSYQVFSIPPIDLDPSHSATIPKSRNPVDHVSYAAAIVLAYTAIEELGLEVRASRDQPSTINGAWNPVVRKDLEGRLQKARINLAETYDWQLRGPKTKVESERPPRRIRSSPWARWSVRDAEVDLVDAIAHVSWLRSKISAHKMKYEFAKGMSVYDVANAQHLARRLFLESLGFWPPVLNRMDIPG